MKTKTILLSSFLLLSLVLLSCKNEKNNTTTMEVKGKVKGLRKGTLYLQKVQDSVLVSVDSVTIEGTPDFSFSTPIETPEVFYLYLNKEDGDSLNDRILFFGEPGIIEIETLLKTFESSATVKGSENQELLQEYRSFARKFDDQNLTLFKAYLEAQQAAQTEKADSLTNAMDLLLRRRYLYSLNFALRNADHNIAPYIALTEVYDAGLPLLDTVASKMTEEVRNSKYGKELMDYLEMRRKQEERNK